MSNGNLVGRVQRILNQTGSGVPGTKARAAIAAVLDDLEADFPWNASLGGAVSTKRRELDLASPQEPQDAPKPVSPTQQHQDS